MLTIAAFKWGHKYTKDHVIRLRNMLRRNLTIPYEFALITDADEDDTPDGVRYIPLWSEMQDAKLCGVRLRAFGKDMRTIIGPRFAWIDLDVVITGNVDHIFSRREPFIAAATPRPPMPYNGSIVMMDAGARSQVYEGWTMEAYHRLGLAYGAAKGVKAGTVSDEGWMAIVLGDGEARWTMADGIYYFRRHLLAGGNPGRLPKGCRIVIMNGRRFDPAFYEWQQQCPWIEEHWR